MPQIVTAYNQVWEQPLATSALTQIQGLAVNLLTGSGWVTVDFQATFFNSDATDFTVSLRLLIDDVTIPESSGGAADFSSPGALNPFARLRSTLRPGTGQHTFKIFAHGPTANTKIKNASALMTVLEHGF